MANTLGPNDPCPCGSGRKYKKCCRGELEAAAPLVRESYREETEVNSGLLQFAIEALGPAAVFAAWNEFHLGEPKETLDLTGPLNELFVAWFIFNWEWEEEQPHGNRVIVTTIAESYIRTVRPGRKARELLMGPNRVPNSFFEVVTVGPGNLMTVRDLLRQTDHAVDDPDASAVAVAGETLFSSLVQTKDLNYFFGIGSVRVPPAERHQIDEFREWILRDSDLVALTDELLRDNQEDIRGFYLEFGNALAQRLPLLNADGDLLVPQILHFDIESSDYAYHALKKLGLGLPDPDSRAEVKVKEGLVQSAEFPWVGRAARNRADGGERVALGTIRIDGYRLSVEVDSYKRGERVRRLIERRLGHEGRFKVTLVQAIESEVKERWNYLIDRARQLEASQPEVDSGSDNDDPGLSLEELQSNVSGLMSAGAIRHWTNWLDTHVPALNHLTPRAAARSVGGREMLENLLQFLQDQCELTPDNLMNPDVSRIRRELALNEPLTEKQLSAPVP